MDRQKDQTQNNGVETPATDLSRRQIIRGMAAVPVVMTLSNGAAAATQSQLNCRATPPADTDKMCRKPEDTSAPVEPFPDGAPHDELVDSGQGTALRRKNTNEKDKDCIVAVDPDGGISFWDGASADPNGPIPVTASCYTSFVT